jgi:hypothetical protein
MSVHEPGEGLQIPGVRLGEVVGRGGMGVVYRAYQERLDRWIAVKVLSPLLADDPAFRTRFEAESRVAAAIEHPNVLPVYDSGEVDGRLYIAMRLIEGSDLRDAVGRSGGLDPERAVRIVAAMADALDAAHTRGLVHRDVKPANILLARPGEQGEHPYLSDFGLTKRLTSVGQTKTGEIVGTVDYMAPEQWRGDRVEARADIYALGAVLFEALTGSVPYRRESDVAKLYAHLNDEVPVPSSVKGGIPAALDTVVARSMAKDPDDRFQSAGDLGRAARAALEGRSGPHDDRTVARGAAAPGGGPAGPGGGGPPGPPTGPTVALPAGGRDTPTRLDSPPPGLTPPAGPGPGPPRRPAAAPPPEAPRSPKRRSRAPLVALLAVVLVAAGAGGAIALSGGKGDGGDTTTSGDGAKTAGKTTPVAPSSDLAADRVAIEDVMSTYESAYNDKSRDEMGSILADDVNREGFGSPDCKQNGREAVLDAYESQWAGTGTYQLSYDPSTIKVSGDTASVTNAKYSIDGGALRRIDFRFRRVGDKWLISRIDAIFQSCS